MVILICLAGALLMGWFGRKRKFGFWGYFFASLALTPLASALILIASDPRKPDTRP